MERKLRITVDGKAYIVTVEDLGETGGPSLAPAGAPPLAAGAPIALATAAPPVTAAAAPAAVGAAAPGDVVAPLGGVIQSVSVALGQQVQQGEAVLVLEAMKMNTVLSAPRAGKVSRVNAKPGDAVEAGQVLVSIDG